MNLPGNEIFMRDSNNWVSEADCRALGAVPLPAGSIVFAKVGAAVFLERKRILSRSSCVDNNMMALIPEVGRCDTRFVHFALQQVRFGDLVSATALPSINGSGVAGIVIPLPPRREQEAIAEALGDADSAIEALDALIAKKRDVKQAAMQQLLTGRTRLAGFSEKWEETSIGELARLRKGRGLSRAAVRENGVHPCLLYGELFTTYGRVAREVVGRTDSDDGELSLFGDVLMPGSTTTSGADLATATALLVSDVRLGGDVNIIRPNLEQTDPRWLAHVITSCHRSTIATLAQGITIHHLYGKDIASLVIHLPSRQEQAALADLLDDVEAEVEALVAERDKMRLVKQGMMQQLLSGRVRLV
jgi:type I restriction enzyme S subunit